MEFNFIVSLPLEDLPKANHYLLSVGLLILESQTNWRLLTPLYLPNISLPGYLLRFYCPKSSLDKSLKLLPGDLKFFPGIRD